MPTDSQEKFRFGPFEVDLRTGELSQNGTHIRLQPQPLRVLGILLEHPGELITREEFRNLLWTDDTFVDFEHSLNTDIKKLRQCLGDDADAPVYIETLPKRGYRFKAPVSCALPEPSVAAGNRDVQELRRVERRRNNSVVLDSGPRRKTGRAWLSRLLAVVMVLSIYVGWKIYKARFPQIRTKNIHRITADGKPKMSLFSDGQHPYYLRPVDSHTEDIVLVSRSGGDDVLVPVAISGAAIPGVSVDGSHFLMCEVQSSAKRFGPLWAVPLPTGAPWRIGNVECEEATYISRGEIAATLNGELRIFDTSGNQLRSLGRIPSPSAGGIRPSPDGKRIRIGHQSLDEIDREETWEINADGTNLHRLFADARTKLGAWTSDGSVYVFPMQDEGTGTWNLWGVPDVQPNLWNFWRVPQPSQLSFTPPQAKEPSPGKSGEIFFLGYDQRGELMIHDPKQNSQREFLGGISAMAVSFSNDRHWITYVSYPDQSLYRSRPDGSEKIRLTHPPLRVLAARWAPDDKLIAFHEISNRSKIYFISPRGGAPLLQLENEECAGDPSWSPDGKSLLYGGCEDSKTLKLKLFELETKKTVVIEGSDELFSPRWSRDGRWIAAMTRDTTRLRIYDFDKKVWKDLPPIPNGDCCGYPAFSDDGRYLYEEAANIWRYELTTGRPEFVAPIDHRGIESWWTLGFSLTPDGIIRMREFGTQEVYSVVIETD